MRSPTLCSRVLNVPLKRAESTKTRLRRWDLSAQGACVGICDNDGKMLYNCISWKDLRGYIVADKMSGTLFEEELAQEINGSSSGFSALAKHLWMQTYMGDLYKKAGRDVTMQEYFLKKFGASEWVTDAASVARESIANLQSHKTIPKFFLTRMEWTSASAAAVWTTVMSRLQFPRRSPKRQVCQLAAKSVSLLWISAALHLEAAW